MNASHLKRLFPHASQSTLDINSDSSSSGPIVERSPGVRPLATSKAKDSDTGIYVVRVTSYRRRLLDEDNLSPKYFVDGCRYAGLLPSDAPDKARIIVAQKKVAAKAEEKTLIVISYHQDGLPLERSALSALTKAGKNS